MGSSFQLTPEQQAAMDAAKERERGAQAALLASRQKGALIGTEIKNQQEIADAKDQISNAEINAQAQNAGVERGDVVTAADGLAGVFGQKKTVSNFTADNVQDTTTAGNKAALASRLAGVDARQNQTMQAAQLAPASQMQAAQLAPAATIAQGPQDQFRAQQMNLAQQLGAGAAGHGPSAAQAQLKLATDRNMAQSLALALGARGGNQAGAMKQAQMQRAMIGQEAGAQSAALAAQEQQAAQQSLGQVLGAGRGADIGMATDQAGLQQQTNLQQGTMQQGANVANQAALNAQSLQQGTFNQQANAANLQAGVDQQKQKDGLVQSYLAQGMALDQAQQQAEIQQRQFNASLLTQQEAARQGIALQNSAAQGQAAGTAASAFGTILGAAATMSDRRVKTDVRRGERKLGELLSLSTSDERAKEDVKEAARPLGELLGAAGAHDYRYKEPGKALCGHGRFVSPMAQELEATEIGRSMVKDTPNGKVVDYGKGLGAMLSGLGWIHRRLSKIEGGAHAEPA